MSAFLTPLIITVALEQKHDNTAKNEGVANDDEQPTDNAKVGNRPLIALLCIRRHCHGCEDLSSFSRNNFELAHQLERFVAFIDLIHRQIAQALETERFHAKTREHAAVDHCFA